MKRDYSRTPIGCEALSRPTINECVVWLAVFILFEVPAIAQQAPDATTIFKRNSPSVVTISTSTGFGSGVLIDSSGVVVTNVHVVKGAEKASIRLASGDVYDDVSVIDFDARKDLALLKIKGFQLPSVELGNSDGLAVGENVYAIGAPQGLEQTISQGIVSALRDSGEGYRVVQTTAAISPGSSGGGLFDVRGHLVAITTFRIKDGEGLNFAVPINYVKGMFSTTATSTLKQLSDTVGETTTRANASATADDVPQLAPVYRDTNGNFALLEQDGSSLKITYSNPQGNIYGRTDFVWLKANKLFSGGGVVNTMCGSFDTRIWAAPRTEAIVPVNREVIRIKTAVPVRVNCDQQRVIATADGESLWYTPSK